MKRILGVTFVTFLVALTAAGIATGESKKAASTAPKAVSTTGEIVDMGCYMGHAAMGAKHAACATKCISMMGMPMGLLTDKNKLYLLTPPHDNQDSYNKCKDMAGTQVQITGEVSEKDGMKSIEVTSVAAAPAAPAKKS
jgi:hypothetical protein